ncbi:helix-hairpin-helix domain-containing protein [Algoriphagus pacificus]|uniref:RNA polymerase, alpha chain C terminal domain n=1 Tax=Algoriphagus pacificus TaxID=2811234 RepID=A0ABS3CID5_9BACT|nr:hypothetical protein [Algoriphagus pacificus]MBN7816284.1 hypothetical protein [Algoriphagus pacificus]
MRKEANLRTCKEGHTFYKSSDCPTCPICENQKVPNAEFLSELSAPARRALERENILSLIQLSGYSEKELLDLHGLGPSSIPKLRKALESAGLMLKK